MMRAAAAERNKQAILEVIQQYFKAEDAFKLLEISSGTGQHVAHLASQYPNAIFQPSEKDPKCLDSINAYIEHEKLHNVRPPQVIDVTHPVDSWTLDHELKSEFDAILNINMIHISSNAAVDCLFLASGRLLKTGGYLLTYGPYSVDGTISPESNVNFDQMLRGQNSEWGLRDTKFLVELALKNGLSFVKMHDMPANNKMLSFLKK
uniref:Methyltransferase-like 26 n=1 Tax=Plectus sambesii TaxID=2011161 RepID=A0A914UYM3_9BILA